AGAQLNQEVRPVAPTVASRADSSEETKLPTSDDLEFPDISLITATINKSPLIEISHGQPIQMKSNSVSSAEVIVSNEPVLYPEDDDLAYPDMGAMNISVGASKKHEEVEEDRDYKVELTRPEVSVPKAEVKKSVSRDFKIEFENDSGLTLATQSAPDEEKHAKTELVQSFKKDKSKDLHQYTEDKKLLHERKVRSSLHPATPREATGDLPPEAQRSVLPEHLKKRNDNYLMYLLVILVLIILSLFFYYYRTILNKPLPV
ncbi:MAG: hypothetical protein PHY93_10625, partial [Bacteriovorax sp.]|nr:hypothetical protein [Bacteriovorax sp.]